MLKRPITYEDFNGETVTDTLYFNLTATELVKLEASVEGGLQKAIEKIVETENIREIVMQFQNIILMAYGIRSEDGKRFMKSDQIREEFSQTAAYDALFMELAGDANVAAIFINSIIPKQLRDEVAKAEKIVDVSLPPVVAAPPPPPTN